MRKIFNFVFAIAVLAVGLFMLIFPIMNDQWSKMWLAGGGIVTTMTAFWIYEDFISPSGT